MKVIDPINFDGAKTHLDTDTNRTSESQWSLPWQDMGNALGYSNLFNLRNLNFTNSLDAHFFVDSCGFNPQVPTQLKSFQRYYFEAVFYLRHVLLSATDRHKIHIPKLLLSDASPTRIVLIASDLNPRKRYLRLWACALLKITHAIMNLEHSGRLSEIDSARQQIFSKIKNVFNLENLKVKDSKMNLQLLAIDWKEAKTRQSIITKILHKPDTIGDEVFDYIGVRFVASTKADIPRLLRFLVESNIIIPHQVIASRTRNNLLNFVESKRLHMFSQELLNYGILNHDEFVTFCKNIPWSNEAEDHSTNNRFSSKFYKSIQITVKHLIRTPNPAYLALRSISAQLARYRATDTLHQGADHLVASEIVRYFPIEIQIMDESSYDLSKFGPASHEKYKTAQLNAVREKVLGSILRFKDDQLTQQEV